MNRSLDVALKEWAVICQALAAGTQHVIFRKGGIAEDAGEFHPEYSRFWLYPTYYHEHRSGIRPEYDSLYDLAESQKPPAGRIRLSHFADVLAVRHVTTLDAARKLAPFHIWSEEVVIQRFNYRTPGIYLLVVRIWGIPQPHEFLDSPSYAGCKSWVRLEPLSTDGARPVQVTDDTTQLIRRVDEAIHLA